MQKLLLLWQSRPVNLLGGNFVASPAPLTNTFLLPAGGPTMITPDSGPVGHSPRLWRLV